MAEKAERFEELVYTFAQGSVQQQYDSLRNLILQRKHHAALKDPAFRQGIVGLYSVAADKVAPDTDRLLAFATLGRIASTIRKMREDVYGEFAKILRESIPNPLLLSEPDDRGYIGVACEKANPEWAVHYCAQAIVTEEAGEQARVAFMKALVMLSGDLASAITSLIPLLEEYVPTTEDPGTSAARRLRRILSALREAIADTLIEPGNEPGKKLAQAITAVFANLPSLKNTEPLFDTADETAAVVHELVRLRFSLATEGATYSSLKRIKEKMSVHEWERCAGKSSAMARVALDITEAVLILARQGIADSNLAGELSVAAGSSKKGRQRLKELAKRSGLSAEIQSWLVNGTLQPVTKAGQASESLQLAEDSRLGDLLVDSLRFRLQENTGRQLLPELEILEPRIASEVNGIMRTGLSLCDALDSLGKQKGLRVRGNPGDEETYAPLEHEVVGANAGSRRVRIIRPVVEQVRQDGVAFVICKGLVEPI